MAAQPDDFDAVRSVVEVLKGFEANEQRRIIRWAQEKLGLAPAVAALPVDGGKAGGAPVDATAAKYADIRSFVQHKQPASDNQFAAVVAYFYAFEAPEEQRKPEIGATDLRDAARLAARKRLPKPIATLHNASRHGYSDKGQERGTFRLNAVGENLVAMALPGGTVEVASVGRSKRKKSGRTKRSR